MSRENILDLFMYACGDSEVPQEYFTWSCISLIAAVLGNRVWYEKMPGTKLLPNQYIILVGPSGTGKGVAIGKASKIAQAEHDDGDTVIPDMVAFQIKATIQHIMDEMSKIHRKVRTDLGASVYLIMPELASSVGSGRQAYSFVHTMVDLWEGADKKHEGTRTHGGIVLYKPCVNWLAGSTREWMMQSIPKDAIDSGFLARTVVVEGKYDFERRFFRPEVPANVVEVWDYITRRLIEVANEADGAMMMTEDALYIDEIWYMNRESPEDMTMAPVWKRQQDLIIKLAMALSIADEPSGVIHGEHMELAQQMMGQVYKSVPGLLSFASTTVYTAGIHVVAQKVREAGTITRTALLKYAYHHGINAHQLDKEVLPSLLGGGQILESKNKNGGKLYSWRERRIIHGTDD